MRFSLPTLLTGTLMAANVASSMATAISPADKIEARTDKYASCYKGEGGDWKFEVAFGGWNDAWGNGLLDNLRGQCGIIYNWQCQSLGNDKWFAWFDTSLVIPSNCVEDAIYLAGGGLTGVQCQFGLQPVPW